MITLLLLVFSYHPHVTPSKTCIGAPVIYVVLVRPPLCSTLMHLSTFMTSTLGVLVQLLHAAPGVLVQHLHAAPQRCAILNHVKDHPHVTPSKTCIGAPVIVLVRRPYAALRGPSPAPLCSTLGVLVQRPYTALRGPSPAPLCSTLGC